MGQPLSGAAQCGGLVGVLCSQHKPSLSACAPAPADGCFCLAWCSGTQA